MCKSDLAKRKKTLIIPKRGIVNNLRGNVKGAYRKRDVQRPEHLPYGGYYAVAKMTLRIHEFRDNEIGRNRKRWIWRTTDG